MPPLPPDPEDKNDDRAEWAQEALSAFMEVTRTDPEDAVADLLADLGHYCDRNEMNLQAELGRAALHYHEETGGEGYQMYGAKYFIFVDADDGAETPIAPDAVPLAEVSVAIARFLAPYHAQGFFLNCRQERVAVASLRFRIQPE